MKSFNDIMQDEIMQINTITRFIDYMYLLFLIIMVIINKAMYDTMEPET